MIADYIKSHIKTLIGWVIVCIIFAVVFSLYELPAGAILYSSAISGAFGAAFLITDFLSYRKKRIYLRNLANEITFTVDNLPENDGIYGDYEKLIKLLYESKRAAENQMTAKYSDMTDYYTLWAHQIKTPIAAMSLILQNRESEDSAELRENLRRIEQYTEMVLVYLRLDSEYTDFLIKEYSLDDIIRQAVRKFSSVFFRKKLSLKYESVNKKVLTDEKWLCFVIEQIISNAVKYTNSGGVEIYAEEPLTLCIKDTGIGIAPEDLPRVFQKGFTGRSGRADKKASGIGLYLCKRICGKLGHTIFAYSSENGTEIKIDLSHDELEVE